MIHIDLVKLLYPLLSTLFYALGAYHGVCGCVLFVSDDERGAKSRFILAAIFAAMGFALGL